MLANVRIVKMLANDDEHNLRYWTDHDDTQGLLTVIDNLACFPTIYSIDAHGETGVNIEDIVQRSQVVEFAALVMQPDDDETQQVAWCLIPHLGRLHPGWGKNAAIYPYPVHVMRHLINDALWAVFDKGSR